MRKSYIFILFLSFILCACKIHPGKQEILTKESAIDPHVPNKEVTRESRIESLQYSISKMSGIYQKMQSFTEENPDFSDGIRQAADFEEKYGERIAEITALTLTDLSDEELEALSGEIPELFSGIRLINDLFEFR